MVGTIKSPQVVVMLNLGATHNFISVEAVNKLGLPVSSTKAFGVSLGTGESVQVARKFRNYEYRLEDSDPEISTTRRNIDIERGLLCKTCLYYNKTKSN
ncbi:hypothetical protein AgCh_030982 [Apium graveolens]